MSSASPSDDSDSVGQSTHARDLAVVSNVLARNSACHQCRKRKMVGRVDLERAIAVLFELTPDCLVRNAMVCDLCVSIASNLEHDLHLVMRLYHVHGTTQPSYRERRKLPQMKMKQEWEPGRDL